MARRLLALLAAVSLAIVGTVGAAPAAGAGVVAPAMAGASSIAPSWGSWRPNAPKKYYLSLGDSLGFGFQADKADALLGNPPIPVTEWASHFTTGYTEDYGAMLARIRPGIQTENLSCPGESSATMIGGTCPWPALALHDPHGGAQLGAAVAFLKAHPGQVSPITLSMGANDVLPVTGTCLGKKSCPELRPLLATLAANLTTILSQLRGAAPGAEIIVLAPYNPFAKAYPSSDLLALALNATIYGAALRQHIRVADAFFAFNVLRAPTLCTLTFWCNTGDIHPTDAGYSVIARTIFNVSGYW